jgi:Spy/CpxP family protein refolding chaperone
MDYKEKYKVIFRLMILLLVLNTTTVGFIIWKSIKRHHHLSRPFPQKESFRDVSGILKTELNLSADQMLHFESVREKYYRIEVELATKIKAEKDSMNAIMYSMKNDTSTVKTLAFRIGKNEEAMQIVRVDQAKELKSICTPTQQMKFEKLVKEIRDYFRPDNRPNQK